MSYDPGVASLWIGGALGWIENVCLRSFLEVGQKVTLFCYEKVANVPEGVIVRDAREIWTPHRRLLRQTGASYLADIFRIHLMSNTDLIWVDCDALCREPLQVNSSGYLVGHFHGRVEIANGVMRLPRDSEALRFLSEIWNDPDYIPQWIRPALQQRIKATPRQQRLVQKFQTKRTIIGPRALTHAMRETGEIKHAVHERVLYPIPWEFADVVFNPHGGAEGWFAKDTVSVHIYGSQVRGPHKKQPPHKHSYLGKKMIEMGIRDFETVLP